MRDVWYRIPRVAAIVFVTAVVTGCAESPTAPSAYAPFSSQDLRVGTGALVGDSNEVRFNYKLWLYDSSKPEHKGPLLESSYGAAPFVFIVGDGSVISGLDDGILGMQEGGLRRLVLPPSMAYGPSRNGSIPPNATLIFEVEVLTVTDPS